MSVLSGSHAPYTERQARGFRVLHPGVFTPAAETLRERSWHAPEAAIGIRITGANGAGIRTGLKSHHTVPFNCSIVGVRLIADAAGSIVFDIKRTRFASLPVDDGDTLTPLAIGRPKLVAAQWNEDRALFGWSTVLLQDDILAYQVLSASGINSVTLSLIVDRNNQP